MATFVTSDLAQMRRCRGAQLHGRMVREAFQTAAGRVPAAGYVHAIRSKLTSSASQWTIVIEDDKTIRRRPEAGGPTALSPQ